MADVAKRRGYSTTENLNSTHVRFVTRIWSYSPTRGRIARRKEPRFFFFLGFLSLGPNSFSNTRVKVFFERMFSPRERRIDWMLKNAFEEL
jgi:hypothetical protein